MKLKAIVLGVIAAAVLFACYPLVSPMQPRTNPNDENSTLPVATDFTAVYNEDPGDVAVSWSPSDPSGVDYSRRGFIVIRKTGSPPVNIFDGTLVSDPFGPDDSSFVDGVDIDTEDENINGAQAGYVNYYALFAFDSEEDGPPSIGTDGNGNLTDTEYYFFAGPVVASVGVPRTVELDVSIDGEFGDGTGWVDDNILTYGFDGITSTPLSIIKFDVSNIIGVTVTNAHLTFMNAEDFVNDATTEYDEPPTLSKVIMDWDSSTEWNIVSDDSFVSGMNEFQFNIENLSTDNENTYSGPELLDIVQDWADGDDNYGLRIMFDKASTNSFTFRFKSFDSDHPPVLEVSYIME